MGESQTHKTCRARRSERREGLVGKNLKDQFGFGFERRGADGQRVEMKKKREKNDCEEAELG